MTRRRRSGGCRRASRRRQTQPPRSRTCEDWVWCESMLMLAEWIEGKDTTHREKKLRPYFL